MVNTYMNEWLKNTRTRAKIRVGGNGDNGDAIAKNRGVERKQ